MKIRMPPISILQIIAIIALILFQNVASINIRSMEQQTALSDYKVLLYTNFLKITTCQDACKEKSNQNGICRKFTVKAGGKDAERFICVQNK
ncbi:UNKNOWN [Stylonychia lemnae]|uniref:Apple domain-containing protein n=1 Tax=Stylonychia lemnae TaxID=5949 RepID=A0A078AYD7_STYLE|nr:UNKNOWN [Stylonychia lemnae]|eukprot:CDW87179.1 UNKNOWN [Stylonychia lemnae]